MYERERVRDGEELLGKPVLLSLTQKPLPRLPNIIVFHQVIMAGGSSINRVIQESIKESAQLIPGAVPTIECRLIDHSAFTDSDMLAHEQEHLLLLGHDLFGIHQVTHQTVGYIGMLRDPVDLFLSRFVSREIFPGSTGDRNDGWKNIAARAEELASIAGHLNQQCCEHSHFRTVENQYANFWQETPEDLFSKAVANIDQHFLVMGVKELYEETIFTILNALSLLVVPLWQPGLRNPWRPRRHDIPVWLLRKLEKWMEADIELYFYCREKFEAKLENKHYGTALELYKSEVNNSYMKIYQELSNRLSLAGDVWGRDSDIFREEEQHLDGIIRNMNAIRDFERKRAK